MTPFRRFCSLLYIPAIVLLLVPAGVAQKGKPDPDMVEMRNYSLTVDKIDRFGDAMHDLVQLAQKNPQLASAMETDSDKDEDLDTIGQRFSAHPEVADMLKSHGFSPREFALCEMVIFQSVFAEGAKQAGADPAKLASDAHVNPANLTFVEQHKAEMDAMRKKYSSGDQ